MFAATTAANAATDTLTVRIKGMRCEECAHKVKNVLRKDAGVGTIDFNLERRTATIAFDGAKTCADSIRAHLAATGRYAASAYSPSDVINRGMGLRIDDMFCQKCVNRVTKSLEGVAGIDSLAPHLDKHYVFVRYDANRTDKATIREAVLKAGHTPVNYYSSDKVGYAYYTLPEVASAQDIIESVIAIDGVEDVNVNARRKSMAVTFFTEETTSEKLLQAIHEAGIKAVVPPAHECKEEQK